MSKYAHLPDMATGPDVYETPDTHTLHTNNTDMYSESVDTERGSALIEEDNNNSLNSNEDSIDRSGADIGQARRGFSARDSAAWEILQATQLRTSSRVELDSEDPLTRIQRLILETKDVSEQLRCKPSTDGDKENANSATRRLLDVCEDLNTKLESLRTSGGRQSMEDNASRTPSTYQTLLKKPPRVNQPSENSETLQLSLLDSRLRKLEAMVPPSHSSLGLPDRLEILERKISHLTPESVSQTINVFKSNLDTVCDLAKKQSTTTTATASSPSSQSSHLHKDLPHLFTQLKTYEPLIPLIPHLISRLKALSTLHTRLLTLSETINYISTSQQSFKTELQMIKGMAGNLEIALKENMGIVQGNVGVIESRVEALER